VDEETRSYFEAMRGDLRGLRGNLQDLDGRMASLVGRMDGLDGRMDGLDGRMDRLDGRMATLEARMDTADRKIEALAQTIHTGFREVGVVIEALRGEIQTIADGLIGNSQALTRLDRKLNARLRASEAFNRLAFAEIRRDIVELRAAL
jgi:chromosome segregation ATPase